METILVCLVLVLAIVYVGRRFYRIILSASHEGGLCCDCSNCKTPCLPLGNGVYGNPYADSSAAPSSELLFRLSEVNETDGSKKTPDEQVQDPPKRCCRCSHCSNRNCPNCKRRFPEKDPDENE